ncbi:MAG: hypothetical protein ACRDM0_14740 [Thermoleophilaceae bacterium]
MNLRDLADRVKELIGGRGGAESAKGDAEEVRDTDRGPGGLTDKAKEAADAIKEPGAGEGNRRPAGSPEAPARPEPERKPGPQEREGGRDA